MNGRGAIICWYGLCTKKSEGQVLPESSATSDTAVW